MMKTGTKLAIALLMLVAAAHILRLVTQAEIIVDGTAMPQWISVLGIIIPAGISWLLYRQSRN